MDYGLDLAQKFQADLLRDERVVWAAQPDPRFRFSGGDIFLVPFSILWGGFAIFWEAAVLGLLGGKGPAPGFFVLWGVPFVLVGQYLIWGRFLYKRYRNRRTFYALTNQRALILTTARSRQLQTLFLNQLPTINKMVRRDGGGTLEFGSSPNWAAGVYANSGMDFMGARSGPAAPTFYDIADVDRVYQLVTQLKTDLGQTA
ncbi:MAG: hypothetical protein E6I37_06960 [Chloroflexi bacterium]|nr:MAG: hypothetical protein E6I37_06960 [Chloroflexota bacterium]